MSNDACCEHAKCRGDSLCCCPASESWLRREGQRAERRSASVPDHAKPRWVGLSTGSALPARKIVYCPMHGDLLALGERRSARCREAAPGHEFSTLPAPPGAAQVWREGWGAGYVDRHRERVGDDGYVVRNPATPNPYEDIVKGEDRG